MASTTAATEVPASTVRETAVSLQSMLERMGARASARRIRFVSDRLEHLTLDAVHQMVDARSMAAEADATIGRTSRGLFIVRNIMALAPLIFTWIALAYATPLYAQEIAADPSAVNRPFLLLWQSGFGGRTVFTFSDAATGDVFLLLLVLVLAISAHVLDHQAQRNARLVRAQLDLFTEQLAAQIVDSPLRPYSETSLGGL